MNISEADINSCNFKQDVINSSTSDVGENFETEQTTTQQQAEQQRAEGSGRSARGGQSGSGDFDDKLADMDMEAEAQLDIDEGHIEILSS